MVGASPFAGEPADTREAIMEATYVALCEHGYADLTNQRIGDEFEKSKSLLYHHYDGKDDLLVDFLEYMLERFEAAIPFEEHEGADEHLEIILDHVLLASSGDERDDFFRAMIELRAQAAHDPAYRDHFTRSDRFFREGLADLVRSGIEEEVFREVDPGATATFLQTFVGGATFLRATADGDRGGTLRDALDEYLRCRLYADDASE